MSPVPEAREDEMSSISQRRSPQFTRIQALYRRFARDLAQGPFDFVVSTWLLSHLAAPTETVLDALETLAPGGTAVFVFFTEPRSRALGAMLRTLDGPLSYQLIDPEPFRELPGLERLESRPGKMATLAVFRASSDADRAG